MNKHYYASATGDLSAVSAGDAISYPEDGSAVDFVAYYPYAASLTNNAYAVDVTNQSSQAAIDLLYSNNATRKDKTVTTPVQLNFKHQLTKIVMNITTDGTVPSLSGLQVTIKGTSAKGSFALADGTLTPDASTSDITANVNAAGSQAEAIILPVTSLTGGSIAFTLNGKTQTLDIPASQKYEPGTQYTYPVTITDANGTISVAFGDATIDDWTSVAGGSINIDFGDAGGTDPGTDPDPEPTETNLIVNPGFEDWTGTLPTGWDVAAYNTNISKSTDIKHSGNNAVKHTSADAAVKLQQEVDVVGGKKYRISYWYLDNDPAASSRMWSYWVAGTATVSTDEASLRPSTYSTDNSEWQQVSYTLTASETATKFRFEIRTYKGSTTEVGGAVYCDDMEVVEVQ